MAEREKLRSFRYLHLALALLAIAASAVLASSKGGHPPAIILLPVVLVAWVLGHVFLALIHWIVRRQGPGEGKPWPLPIVLLFALFACLFFVMLNGLGGSLLMSNERISPHRFFALVTTVLPTVVVFLGILLRKPWARYCVAAVPIFFFLFLGLRIGLAAVHGQAFGHLEWLAGAAHLGASGAAAWYLLKSPKVADFFSSGAR